MLGRDVAQERRAARGLRALLVRQHELGCRLRLVVEQLEVRPDGRIGGWLRRARRLAACPLVVGLDA